MSEHVLVERSGPLQVIRLNRPEKKNAITRAMYLDMKAALEEGDADESVRCHVMLGSPGAFSAGNDLADFLAVATGGEGGQEVYDFLLTLASCRKPLVSGADGIAVGIGTTIHLHCDLTLATPRTVFSTPFVDLGLVPEAASSLLAPMVIGHQRAFALLALGEGLPAQEAKAMGLIHGVVEPAELEGEVFGLADRLAAKPPEALRIARDLIRGPREHVLARIREEAVHFMERLKSEEARSAFMAFMSRK
ncbi:enoyl-CoA hydratase [Nitratireductor indicus C115]|uniref:Enoyl-CoA hydratase n=1 Tax=Nitratireductor indicus C115 TaxID=1231190 RepID=K2N1K0_9HYPH|nr:crotonase/enoyl-CoA hydratase family protein [Nitratireductor indicus]EKF41363.1 enoyl-CoA hydratase [Nitratireductor indicus C115]SFQ72485.1 Enoyl-CoA hydratase/carnithine racemase [Nitratireductor indicus]